MKKTTKAKKSELEYNFSRGIRGKYAKRYRQGTNIVVLEKDVAAVFPTSNDVNRALRSIIRSHTSP